MVQNISFEERLQSGVPNPQAAARTRASTKPHSDIWAGDPASGILVFLSVLGNPKNSGIRFFEPKAFPLSYVRTLEDYNEGAPLMEGAEELASFDTRGWFLAAPYLLHQTTKSGSGTRISIDFRFIPKQRVSSDLDEDTARKPFFISFPEWMTLGKETLITPEQGMMEFSTTEKKDSYTVGYPVKFHLTDMEQAHEDTPKNVRANVKNPVAEPPVFDRRVTQECVADKFGITVPQLQALMGERVWKWYSKLIIPMFR